jgi:hypothetical protein
MTTQSPGAMRASAGSSGHRAAWSCHCHNFGSLLLALRAAQPRRQGFKRHRPAYQARESLRLYVPG